MKLLNLFMALGMFFVFGTVNAQETVIPLKEVQPALTKYVKEHFPDAKVVKVIKDKEATKVEYEVDLSNGAELQFNIDLGIEKVDGNHNAIPASVVPSNIAKYVTENYPDTKIVKWEKKRKGQEIELDSDVDLLFDFDGKFLRVDN